jgi:competence protein ComGC
MDTPLQPSPQVKNSALAIWSLVLGCVGLVTLLVCIGPLFAIPAVICGHMAYGRIKRSNGALAGQGLALGGLITGYVAIGLAIVILPMMAAIAIPNFVKAREIAQRNTCINNLRLIDGAKQQWALENNKTENDTPTEQDLDKYLPKGVTFSSLHCPVNGTYTINKASEPPTCSIPNHTLSQSSP